MKKRSSGFSSIEALLILLLVGLVGFAGWRIYKAKKDTQSSGSNEIAKSQTVGTTQSTLGDLVTFHSDELNFSFTYPKKWGNATLAKGTFFVEYQHGDYRQVTFDSNDKVDINFVLGAYSSPIDGCGITDPVSSQLYGLSQVRASEIGWTGKSLKTYFHSQGQDSPVVNLTELKSDSANWKIFKTSGKTFVYQSSLVTTGGFKVTEADMCSDGITQEEADAANAYYKFVHFVTNYTNEKVKGVNAQLDARTIEDSSTDINDIINVLNSLK